MTSTQAGEAGASLLRAVLMISSRGELDIYYPVADDDHRDLVVGLRGRPAMACVQVKTSYQRDRRGLVRVKARLPKADVPDHPSFIYAVLLVGGIAIEVAWLVPSPEFNRLVYKEPESPRLVDYEFVADPSRRGPFTPYQMD
ncbi:MAG TPA: hypothetical protein VK131_01010, partial [Candidatus Acidoferrales bacterium]|nr:hypothetical protein [Candidatus Acidoferrales bacterium]